MQLGKFLAEKRLKAGLSQGQVALELGYTSPQYISNYERGKCGPAIKKSKRLATLLGIPKKQMVELLVRERRQYITKNFN